MSGASGLQVKGVTKRFKHQTVLDDVSFDVPKGKTLVLFGPSGAGKTVLLRCIAGAIAPEAGAIFIDGQDVTDTPPEARGTGMAFQNFALFPHMSAFENIASPLRARRSVGTELKKQIGSVARLLKIDHVLDHAPKELSNGQKQRTALARALVAEPGVLLLDDPLRNVDAKLRFEMRLELPKLLADRKATVVYVTQDYKEAMALGDRIAVLDEGRIAQIGSAEEIYCRPESLAIARLFGDPVINLLDVVPETDSKGLFARLSNQRVQLPSELTDAAGRACVIGIRPEAMTIVSSNTPGAIPVTVEAETPLNEKTVTLAVTKRGRELLASRPAGADAPSDGLVGFVIDGKDAILFDRGSGTRIGGRGNSRRASS